MGGLELSGEFRSNPPLPKRDVINIPYVCTISATFPATFPVNS